MLSADKRVHLDAGADMVVILSRLSAAFLTQTVPLDDKTIKFEIVRPGPPSLQQPTCVER